MELIPGIYPLKGVVQHYDWGGFDFLPSLLRQDNSGKKPFAELWIGDHPNGPAATRLGERALTLQQLLREKPHEILGPVIAKRYQNRMPYLFKVLDVRHMLSIQAHPTKRHAEEGFAKENAAGLSLKDPRRNYRDDNHKPEVHVALTDFWLLHGFQPREVINTLLASVSEFRTLRSNLPASTPGAPADQEWLRTLYGRCMTMSQEEVDAIIGPLVARLQHDQPEDKDSPDYWAWRAAEQFPSPGGHWDRGIFSLYLLNLVHLRPGEGTFQLPGVLHAYLEGLNVELMANSDNVLRGGLTSKHIDPPELLRTLKFVSARPSVLVGEKLSATENVYRTPAEEFELSRVHLIRGQIHRREATHGVDSLILTEGSARARSGAHAIILERGDIILVPQGVEYVLESQSATTVFFRASMPAQSR